MNQNPYQYRNYADELTTFVRSFLDNRKCRYTFREDIRRFAFNILTEEKKRSLECRIKMKPDGYIVSAMFPQPVPKDRAADMSQYVCLINFTKYRGEYKYFQHEGILEFSCYVPYEMGLQEAVLAETVKYAAGCMDTAYNWLLAIVDGGTLQDALAVENKEVKQGMIDMVMENYRDEEIPEEVLELLEGFRREIQE